MESPSTPSEAPKPVYQKQTTGTLSGDIKEAVKVKLSSIPFKEVRAHCRWLKEETLGR